MIRAQSRALALSVMIGKRWRSSIALALQQPFPAERLAIVATGQRQDAAA
jgi:hypothetical protein